MTDIYEIRADKYNANPDDYDSSAEFPLHRPLLEQIECLTPYLAVDREAFATSRAWFDGQHAHIVIAVECTAIDHDDMVALLLAVARLHADFAEVTCTQAPQPQVAS